MRPVTRKTWPAGRFGKERKGFRRTIAIGGFLYLGEGRLFPGAGFVPQQVRREKSVRDNSRLPRTRS